MYWWVCLSYLRSCVIPIPVYLFPSSGLGVFRHNFFKYIFDLPFSLFSFWNPYNANVWMLNVVPGISSVAFLFFKICFPYRCSDCVVSIFLTSRSLTCSSVLLCLLFIPSSVLLNYSFLTGSFFFIFSSSLLKCSLIASIVFPNSVNIFIINVLNSLSRNFFYFCFLNLFSFSFIIF